MRLVLNEIESQIQDISREFFTQKMPVTHYRKIRDNAVEICYDASLWQEMVQLGWSGITIAESYGGFDSGLAAAGVIAEEAGKTLAPSPFLSNAVIASSILQACDMKKLLQEILTGKSIFGIAFDDAARSNWLQPKTVYENGKLNGVKTMAIDAVGSDHLLVSASNFSDAGIALFVIPTQAVAVKARSIVDHRNYGAIKFDNFNAKPYELEVEDADKLMRKTLNLSRAVLACEMLGNAQAAFDLTLTYLKERKQFGQPLSSFQALQHRASEMFVMMENARSMTLAALTADYDDEKSFLLAMLAKAEVGTMLDVVSRESVQMHGGMGVTDEFDVGLYLKRARVSQQLLGNSDACLDEYASAQGF